MSITVPTIPITLTTLSTSLRAFHGNKKIKAKYLRRIRQHVKRDELIRGIGWENGKGCSVGCTLDKYDHAAYETELGIPIPLAYLEDSIFENLPLVDSMIWPERFLAAIPIGADLSKITAHLVIWQFEDDKWGLKNTQEVKDDPNLAAVCIDLMNLYKRILADGVVIDTEWNAIWARAWAGGGALTLVWAWVGAWPWARTWAWVGAWPWARARSYQALADKLLELLAEAPTS